MKKEVMCPVCRENFELEEELEEGDVIQCSVCYEDLRVVSLNPFRLEEEIDFSEESYHEEEEEESDDLSRRKKDIEEE